MSVGLHFLVEVLGRCGSWNLSEPRRWGELFGSLDAASNKRVTQSGWFLVILAR